MLLLFLTDRWILHEKMEVGIAIGTAAGLTSGTATGGPGMEAIG